MITQLETTVFAQTIEIKVRTVGALTKRPKYYVTVSGVYGETQSVEIAAGSGPEHSELERVMKAGTRLFLASFPELDLPMA